MSLYENIAKRRKSGKPMRKKGDKGAPTDAAFRKAALTAKKPVKKKKVTNKKKKVTKSKRY